MAAAPNTGGPATAAGNASLPPCPKLAGKVAPTGNCTWYDPAHPDAQHLQSATYDKANESLTVLIQYTQRKMDDLNGLTDKTEKLKLLGNFCDLATPEDGDDCADRYKRHAELELARMRAAVIKNDTSAASLMTIQSDGKKRTGNALAVYTPETDPAIKARGPMQAYLPSASELEQMYKAQSARMQGSIVNDFTSWLAPDGEYRTMPQRRDFPAFKHILRNPDRPADGYFTVEVKDANGEVAVDKKAYDEALAAYQKAGGGMVNGKSALDRDAETMLNQKLGPADASGKRAPLSAARREELAKQLAPRDPTNTEFASGSSSRNAFAKSRDGLVEETNTLPGAGRATASKPTGVGTKPTAAPGDAKLNKATGSANYNTIGVRINDMRTRIIDSMTTDSAIGASPGSAVELPPMPED